MLEHFLYSRFKIQTRKKETTWKIGLNSAKYVRHKKPDGRRRTTEGVSLHGRAQC